MERLSPQVGRNQWKESIGIPPSDRSDKAQNFYGDRSA